MINKNPGGNNSLKKKLLSDHFEGLISTIWVDDSLLWRFFLAEVRCEFFLLLILVLFFRFEPRLFRLNFSAAKTLVGNQNLDPPFLVTLGVTLEDILLILGCLLSSLSSLTTCTISEGKLTLFLGWFCTPFSPLSAAAFLCKNLNIFASFTAECIMHTTTQHRSPYSTSAAF